MANAIRGEAELAMGAERRPLALTLGALAELEEAVEGGLAGLAARLAEGRLSLCDALAVLAAGASGAGRPTTADEIGRAIPAAALPDALQTAAALLSASFGGGSPSRPPPPQAAP